jgi:hypothetical protein
MTIFQNGFALLLGLLVSGQAPSQRSCDQRGCTSNSTAFIDTIKIQAPAASAMKAADPESGHAAPASTDPIDLDDGSSAAPACELQHPSLLHGYRIRPSWRVAGVDYCVGYPAGSNLKDPSTISIPGVSVDKLRKLVTVTGNNVTLDGYDFSADGGWGVITKAATTSILNSKFVVGSNAQPPIQGAAAASNLYVGHTSIDGKAIDVGNVGMIQMKGVGLSVQHSWITNSAGDMIQAHNKGIVDLRYNLIEQGGLAPGAHGDFLEVFGGPFVASILHNTTFQHSGGSGGTQGLMLEPDFLQSRGTITSAEYGYNTFIASGGNQNYFLGVTVDDIVGTVTVHDNYFDAKGTYGFAPGGVRGGPNDGSNKTVFRNNVNMVTGAIVQDIARPVTAPRP